MLHSVYTPGQRIWGTTRTTQHTITDSKLMFAQELVQAGHTKRFTITEAGGFGWEVTEEQDSAIVRQILYTDWHRVERALTAMMVRVSELQRAGWRVSQAH